MGDHDLFIAEVVAEHASKEALTPDGKVDVAKLDMLIAAGICKSRSESAAFLLQRGIESSGALFDRIESVTNKITSLRHELLESVKKIDG